MRAGLQEAAPVFLGLVPLGLAFGVFITQLGFAWWWAPVFSVVIYAGSMELLAPGLIDSRADGTQVLTTQIALQASWVGSGTLAALTSAMLPENIAGWH